MATPYCTFFGPDGNGTLYLQDAIGNRNPLFMTTKIDNKAIQIFRINMWNGQQTPFASAVMSSTWGTIDVSWNGQVIKMRQSWKGMTGGKEFTTPAGDKMIWKPESCSGSTEELWDERRKIKIAKYKTKSEPKLEIFVQADNTFIDMLLAVSLALYRYDEKVDGEAKAVGKAAFKVISGVSS